ncbi:MAG: DUF1295 domain-containing protein [Proteobacteria bacterium]|nr:DUF1295 domain-containing protein [Pseudomonadota bacterium]
MFAGLAFAVYRYSPHTVDLRLHTPSRISLNGADVLSLAFCVYLLALTYFFLCNAAVVESRALIACRGLRTWLRHPRRLSRDAKQALLTVLLKMFFAPLMVLFLWGAFGRAFENASLLWLAFANGERDALQLFNAHGFWLLFQLTLLVDVGWFTVGYMVERSSLRNTIVSVDPTLVGWLVTLACYPPFNALTVRVLGGNVADFPHFTSTAVHVGMNTLLLLAMVIYASASVALGWKASNLTHRGIVSGGPYRYIRHPAYTAKNIAWWIASVPAFTLAWQASAMQGLQVAGATLAWSGLYVLRALTEEDHLRSVDEHYSKYCEAVRFRFLPGLI